MSSEKKPAETAAAAAAPMSFEEFLQICDEEECISGRCMVFDVLELLGGKWRLLTLYQLAKKPSYRFGELKRSIPRITSTMLTTVLRDMEQCELVAREQFNEIPPHVEYSLTGKGRDLLPIFYKMAKWAQRYL